jgi:hypothetical protein
MIGFSLNIVSLDFSFKGDKLLVGHKDTDLEEK